MSVDASRKCDACGLPPVPPKRLHACTRCQAAWYHDRFCQRRHYPTHKAVCRRSVAAASAAKTNASSSDAHVARNTLTEFRNVDGKGRALIATAPLATGCHPLPTSSGLCEPLAHPVLLESMRTSRCAYCFRTIHEATHGASALHCHCSSKCRELDENWRAEQHAARKLPSPPSPTALSCSRILRMFQDSPSALEEYNQLCFNVDVLSDDEKETYTSILTQCHLFLRAMGDAVTAKVAHDMLHPDPTPAHRFLSRMSMNGFTIASSELLPVGHGVYPGASMINHSCRPNAVPSFWLRPSSTPKLLVTACRSIKAGEEVTIGYCDASTPRHVRREALWANYKFACLCSLCIDADRDDDVVGLKCTTKNCKGKVRSVNATNLAPEKSPGENARRYRCNSCGTMDFEDALRAQAVSIEQIKRVEATMNGSGNDHEMKKAGDEARGIYDSLKRYCNLQTSYYNAWSADLFVHWTANALQSLANEQEQLAACHEALRVMNECRSAAKFCFDYPGNSSWHIKRGVEAKLRLFANPMDMEAMGMLKNARVELQRYYPSDDETLLSLNEALAVYSFS